MPELALPPRSMGGELTDIIWSEGSVEGRMPFSRYFWEGFGKSRRIGRSKRWTAFGWLDFFFLTTASPNSR